MIAKVKECDPSSNTLPQQEHSGAVLCDPNPPKGHLTGQGLLSQELKQDIWEHENMWL